MFAALAVALACAGASLPPSAPPNQLRPALRCLINTERARVGVGPLRGSRRLRLAAQVHASAMVAGDFFAHGDLMARLRFVGFEEPLTAGEALEAGCAGLATPAAAVAGLMGSPPHRALLLSPRFRRMGIAVIPWAYGARDCPGAGTWVLDLVGPV